MLRLTRFRLVSSCLLRTWKTARIPPKYSRSKKSDSRNNQFRGVKVKNLGEHSTQNRSARERSRKWTRINYKFLRCFLFISDWLFFAVTTEQIPGALLLPVAQYLSREMLSHIVWFTSRARKSARRPASATKSVPEHQNPSTFDGRRFSCLLSSHHLAFSPIPPASTQQFSISHASACLLTLDRLPFCLREMFPKSQKQILLSPNNFRALRVCFCFDLGGWCEREMDIHTRAGVYGAIKKQLFSAEIRAREIIYGP